MIPALLLLACAKPEDSAGPGAPTSSTTPTVPSRPTTPPPPADVDDDGYLDDTDCDDYDPAVFPGATESWNGADDDCDGRIDADGAYNGTFTAAADTIYEGTPYAWALPCTGTLDRIGDARIDFVVTCPTEPDDPIATLLLGAEVTVTPIDTAAVDAAIWTGAVTFSSASWAADGDGYAEWSTFDDGTLAATLSTTWLTIDLEGAFTHAN